MSLEAALRYAARGWEIFPCQRQGEHRKWPLTRNGGLGASTDRAMIIAWWRRWPEALIGFATGRDNRIVVLDVDVKTPQANGFDTLADLGYAVLPATPLSHTPSGGLHIFLRTPEHVEIRNTQGERGRGVGAGLDWRGTGGYVIVPSLGSGYRWDPYANLDSVPIAPVPQDLLPRQHVPGICVKPVRATVGLSPYGERALDSAVRRMLNAPHGEQEATLNSECFCIGTLAGAGAVPADFARDVLYWAAERLTSYNSRRPWRAVELKTKVDRAFDAGLRSPRRAQP